MVRAFSCSRRGFGKVACIQFVQRRFQCVYHRAVAQLRAADPLHPIQTFFQGCNHAESAGRCITCRSEEDRQKNSGRPAHRLCQFLTDCPEKLGMIGQGQPVECANQGARGTCQRRARVAIPGFRVQRIQVCLGSDQDLAAARQEVGRGLVLGRDRLDRTQTVGKFNGTYGFDRFATRPSRGGAWCAEPGMVFGFERKDRYGEAAHVQRRHHRCRTDNQLEVLSDGGFHQVIGEDGHFQFRGPAKIVQQDDMGNRIHHRGQFGRHSRHRLFGIVIVDLKHACFAMNAKAKLCFACTDALFFR